MTDSNAHTALQITFAPIEFSVYAAELVTLVADLLTLFLERDYQLACPKNPGQLVTMTHVDNDNDYNISSGDLLRWSDRCLGPESGSEVELSVERAVAAPFDIDELTGRVEFSLATSAGEIDGTFALTYSAASARAWSLTDVTVESSITELTGSTSATRIEKTVVDFRTYAIDADGRTESDRLGGTVRFSSESSFSGIQGRFPKEGAILLSASESRIRVTPSTDRELVREHAQYHVDTSGSGEYGPATTVRWDSFLSGLLVNLTPNEPHELVDVRIIPEAPDTTDDLTVAYEVSNPDNDDLLVDYEWRRNGRLLEDYDYDALPSEETAKGDVIEVTLSISDGIADTIDAASTTIVDAPPVVSVPNAPDAVAYGDQAMFRAEASDPDGEGVGELAFQIEHGPAGMTVDPASGEVSWLADAPMFERYVDVDWGVTVDVAGARAATGTIRVSDPTREFPLFRTDTKVPRTSDGLRIGDFDGDGRNEALIAGGILHELESHGDAYIQSWAHPYLWTYALATGDIDSDGRHEIFAHTGAGRHAGSLVRLNGVERRVESSVEVTVHDDGQDVRSECMNLELADLDNDGSMELVCLASSNAGRTAVVVFEADDLEEIWRSDVGNGVSNRLDYLKVGNVDEDEALEIVTARVGGDRSDVGYVHDGSSGEVEWLLEGGFGFEIELADVTGNGVKKILGTGRSGVAAYDAVEKKQIGEIERREVTMAAADITGDAIDEVVLVSPGFLEAYRYDSDSNGFERVFELIGMANPGGGANASRIGDVDNDGVDELLWSARSGYQSDELAIVDLGRSPANEWSSHGTDLDGPFIGGQVIRSDSAESRHGFATATTNDERGGTRMVSIGADGDLAVSEDLDPNDKEHFSIFVSDYDDDATDEMFVNLGDKAGVYDAFTGLSEWTTPGTSVLGLTGGDFNGDQRDDLVVLSHLSVFIYDVFQQMLIGEFEEAASGTGPTIETRWSSSIKKKRSEQLQLTRYDNSDVLTNSSDRTGIASNNAPHAGALYPVSGPEVYDLDGDGSLEILISRDSEISAYSKAPGSDSFVRTLSYEVNNASIDDFAVGDVDGDGRPEVFLSVSSNYVWRLNSNFEFQNELGFPGVSPRSIMIEQTPERRKNLVVIGDNRFTVVDPETGAVIWSSPDLLLRGLARNGVRFHEADDFGRNRVTVGTGGGMYITR